MVLNEYLKFKETERLIARPLIREDIPIWNGFFKDPKAIAYFPDTLINNNGVSEKWISRQIKRYGENQFGLMALIEKKSGNFAGQCGLLTQNVDDIKELEIGYHLFSRYWGKGYASEAAGMFRDFAFDHQLAPSLISIIDIRNKPSQKVAERNGMIKGKLTAFKGLEVNIYRISMEEWLKN